MTGHFQQWPVGKPLPWGWHLSHAAPISAHSVLIKRDYRAALIRMWRRLFA